MTLGEVIRADLISLIQDDPVTFTFGGADYTGTVSGATRRRPLELGGFEPDPDLTIVVNLNDIDGNSTFPDSAPSCGAYVTVGGVEYRVERSESDSFGEALQIDLRSKAK